MKDQSQDIRLKLLGLGEQSLAKSYYPELQKRIAELEASEQKYRAVFNTVTEALFVHDGVTGMVVDVNEAAVRLFKASREELMGFAFADRLSAGGEYDRTAAVIRLRAAAAGVPQVHLWRSRDATGRLFWTEIRMNRVESEGGGAERVVAAVDDVTVRRHAEEALRVLNRELIEADRRKNEFMAMLSHELRNPLGPIRNSIYVLNHAVPGGEQAKRAQEIIDRQVQHIARLVDDLLDVTRVTRGRISLQRERVDLTALVRRVVDDQRAWFSAQGIDLQVQAAAQPLWVSGDVTRLAQVVGNLLDNAAKFTPRGGQTVVALESTSRQEVVLRVRDNGVGMSPETLAHLFKPFAQATQGIERSQGGLGLGLALVKGLVEMHLGTVTAHSDGEGKGAEFKIVLPLASPPEPAVAVGPDVSPTGGLRILVIEDNVDAADSLREGLEFGAHEVTVAYTGPEGVQAAQRCRPDVVFCDIGLPGLDGFGVARRLRADADAAVRSAFLVALSGYAGSEDVCKAKEAGFDRHVAKPASLDDIERLLAEAPVQAPVRAREP